jgi:hypothetical protein
MVNDGERSVERAEESSISGNGSQSSDAFEKHLSAFLKDIEELSARFGTPKTSIIKSIIDTTCEYRSRYEIENGYHNEPSQKFDSYFTIKHEFQKNRFVQRLMLSMRLHGLKAWISTEDKHIVGVFDVLITNSKFLVTISDKKGSKKIVVEWKSGATFSMSQIERYLWEGTTVVLVRVQMNQVIRIRRRDIEKYLLGSLVALTERVSSTSMTNALQKIPGPYCTGCPVTSCEFYKTTSNGDKVISFSSDAMQKDLILAYMNLDRCVVEAIEIVIQELTS